MHARARMYAAHAALLTSPTLPRRRRPQDPVVFANMDDPAVGKPDLNSCVGVVVEAGEGGVGPVAASGVYSVRVEFPEEKKGQTVDVDGANLRLLAPMPQ